MKTYKRIKGTKVEKEVMNRIEQHEKFKNSFMCTPPGNANARRSYEKYHSRPDLIFVFDDKKYEISQTVSCSCKNVYYSFSVYVDSEKKNITALKKLIK